MTHFVVGCGGGGSWLVPKLARMEKEITLVDGDTLEKKNLDRQLFDESAIGQNKALALASKYGNSSSSKCLISFRPEYYHVGLIPLKRNDVLWCCVDNHSCRREVLAACDQYRCKAIFAANDYEDAEAYYYQPSFQDTPNDPRVVYPVILTDDRNDPLRPEGCVEASVQSPQLVLANGWSADMALHLYWFWLKRKPMPDDTKEFWPVHHKVSGLKFQTIRYGDRLAEDLVEQTC